MNTPLKWHGGKHYLAKQICELFPPHTTYVEPYAGGLSVLLARPQRADGKFGSEIVNDIDGQLTNFWRVLQDPEAFESFYWKACNTPFSEYEWEQAKYKTESSLCTSVKPDPEAAHTFFVFCRQSMAGRIGSNAVFSPLTASRLRGGRNAEINAWFNAIEGLPEIHHRLSNVLIMNRPAVNVIKIVKHEKRALIYLDPPYVHLTREKNSRSTYRHEMSEQDHIELCKELNSCSCNLVLSGYWNWIYEKMLTKGNGWEWHEIQIPNHSSKNEVKQIKQEIIWRKISKT